MAKKSSQVDPNNNTQLPENVRFVFAQHAEGVGVTMYVQVGESLDDAFKDYRDAVEEMADVKGWRGRRGGRYEDDEQRHNAATVAYSRKGRR